MFARKHLCSDGSATDLHLKARKTRAYVPRLRAAGVTKKSLRKTA